MSTTKGKQGTKGQKQIYDENNDTVKFYVCMTSASLVIHMAVRILLFSADSSSSFLGAWGPLLWTVICQLGSLLCMKWMAKPMRNEKGQIIDAGLDLNMEGGFGEYCKDIVILSSAVQLLALISSYFYFMCLLVPLFALYKLWVGVLAPWFFAPAPEESEGDEKKKKKKERKLKRI